ncbi:Peptidase [uncultured virus]|nr:Peptidase [uncultured virus]
MEINTTDWNDLKINIINLAEKQILISKNYNQKLIELDINKQNIKKFLSILSNDITSFTTFHSTCNFLNMVSSDCNVKKKCAQADIILTKYINELNLNKLIYNKILKFYNFSKRYLDQEDIYFLDSVINSYKKNGINLSEKNKKILLKIKQEIFNLENILYEFTNKLENQCIELKQNEIHGLPSSFIASLNIVNNLNEPMAYTIQLNKENFYLCMRYLQNSKIREKIELFYTSSYTKIIDSIIKLIILRDKLGKILGFKNYSEFKNNNNIIKNSETVKDFLTNILQKMDERYIKEIDTISKLNKDDNNIINTWDINYCVTNWKKEYGINEQTIKEYFPLISTFGKLLEFFEEMFLIKFIKTNNENTWTQDILTYHIFNKDGIIIGLTYFDIYYKKNKIKQVRCYGIQPACFYPLEDEKYQIPICALVASFNKKEILITHSDIISLFHELAHIMHYIFGKTKYSLFSGTNSQNDFTEIPALVFENFAWDKQILKKISCHYKTKQPLPDFFIDKMVKIRDLGIGIHFKKHILISLYDQLLHSSSDFMKICEDIIYKSEEKDMNINLINALTNLYKQLHKKIMCSVNNNSKFYEIGISDKITFPSEWYNIIIGNDAQQYCYLLGKINAADIINEKLNKPISDFGKEFINKLLSNGGTKDSSKLLYEYLGRNPSLNGFLDLYSLNIDPQQSFFFNTTPHNIKNIEVESIYSNRYTEIITGDDDDLEQKNVGYKIIKKKLDENNFTEENENTETLKRYNKIFLPIIK